MHRDGAEMEMLLKGGLLAACLGLLAGCSSSMVTGGDLIRTGEPSGTIVVKNDTSHVIDAVLISACNASTYGLNRLPQGVGIPRGGSFEFNVSAGCWDVDAGIVGVGEARQRLSVDPRGITTYTVTD